MDAFNVHSDNTETIHPICQTLKWHLKFNIHIAPTKDIAIQEEDNDMSFIKIYLDRSGIEGNIGAAVVLYWQKNSITAKRALCYCLGPNTRHTVYKGEVVGEILGQELLYRESSGFG